MLQENIEVVPLSDIEFQEIVGRVLETDWQYDCTPYCFKLAKQIGVEFWQVGALGYFTSMSDLMGGGDLAWVCGLGPLFDGEQWFYKDIAVRVYSKEGELIADKRPRDFTYRELMKYAVDYLWVMPKEWVDVRCAFQFTPEQFAELKRTLPTIKKHLLTVKEYDAIVQDPRGDFGEMGGFHPFQLTLGKVSHDSVNFPYVGTADPDGGHKLIGPLNARLTYYIMNLNREFVDVCPGPNLTFEFIKKYGANHLWIDLYHPREEDVKRIDAEVAAYKAAHPEK